VMLRLGLRSRRDLVAVATQSGLIAPAALDRASNASRGRAME